MKKIKQAEENEKKQTTKDNLNRLETYLFQQTAGFDSMKPTVIYLVKGQLPAYTHQYSSRHLDTIFQPPRQIV